MHISISQCAIRDNLLLTTVTATDLVDTGSFATIEYSAVAGDVARFDLNSVTGDIRVAPGLNWDYETPPNMFVLEVRATDNPMGTPRLTVRHVTFSLSLSLSLFFLCLLHFTSIYTVL